MLCRLLLLCITNLFVCNKQTNRYFLNLGVRLVYRGEKDVQVWMVQGSDKSVMMPFSRKPFHTVERASCWTFIQLNSRNIAQQMQNLAIVISNLTMRLFPRLKFPPTICKHNYFCFEEKNNSPSAVTAAVFLRLRRREWRVGISSQKGFTDIYHNTWPFDASPLSALTSLGLMANKDQFGRRQSVEER